MAKVLIVHIVPEGGGRPSVGHLFYGETEAECRENFAAHAAGCKFLAPAIAEGRIDEELSELDDDEWPDFEVGEEDDEGEPPQGGEG